MDSFQWKVRGYLVGISIERFDVGIFLEGEFMLQMNLWDKKEMMKWNLITVNGAAQTDRKNAFLRELASFCNRSKEPVLIAGDLTLLDSPLRRIKLLQ